MPEPNWQTIEELAPQIALGQLSAERLTEECLNAIRDRDRRLNAFITVCGEQALAEARRADTDVRAGRYRGPLHGIPISVKDLVDVAGLATTAASRVRQGHVAGADALVVARLREAGAIVIGKTNLHEFAYGTTSEDSAFGPARNPLDPDRSPGGSSGGSAASIAAGMSIASVGTDTGGSIRIPAAACGTVGLKPTLGEVPCGGVVPLSRSLDHVGPLARSVADAWMLFEAMAGHAKTTGPRDAAAASGERPSLAAPRPYFFDVLDSGVRDVIEAALGRLSSAGFAVEEAAIAHAGDAPAIYLHVQLPESSAYHASVVDERPEDYTPPVRLRLELGRYVLAEDYARAQRGREVLRMEVDAALDGHAALVLPTLPIPAPLLGQSIVNVGGADWPVRSMMLRLTQVFNLTGHPAITLPCGRTPSGLPCGLQLVGRRGATVDLLRVALACERTLRAAQQ
ncbi:MAG: amidase [Vicinamibacterales bacterium]